MVVTTFLEMLAQPTVRVEALSRWLDARTPDERVTLLGALDRKAQRRLYMVASLAPGMGLADLVPPDRAPRTEVRHRGKNTLPLPAAHKRFEKRFCRPDDGSDRLFGYNEAPSRGLIGPGYFVAYPTRANPVWASRGDVVVDYFQVPDGPVAETWPPVVSNREGLQRFVYQGTRDFLRRVSSHFCIGAAYKGERALGHYFVLLREDG